MTAAETLAEIPPWTKLPCDECGDIHYATRTKGRKRKDVELCDGCIMFARGVKAGGEQAQTRIRELEAELATLRGYQCAYAQGAHGHAGCGRYQRDAPGGCAMKERPILFSSEMVRAILDGRKWQTRRVVKSAHAQEADAWAFDPESGLWESGLAGEGGAMAHGEWLRCPYGAPGDLLVPRTTWATSPEHDQRKPKDIVDGGYRPPFWSYWQSPEKPEWCGKSRPGRFLPRELWWTVPRLEVTGVRVERLQEISEDDARAEGIRRVTKDGDLCKYCVFDEGDMSSTAWADMPRTAIEAFRQLWDSINARRGLGWEANLWVWVIEFRPLGARHAG